MPKSRPRKRRQKPHQNLLKPEVERAFFQRPAGFVGLHDEHQRDRPGARPNGPFFSVRFFSRHRSAEEAYWQRMVGVFPTIESMATSQVDAVLKAWEGAGHYSRAVGSMR